METLNWLANFHLLRPYWLLALPAVWALIWFYLRATKLNRNWASVIDQRLLPYLLQGDKTQTSARKKPARVLLLTIFSLVIFSLAGPAFEKRPQPVFKAQSALVILLDLSRSMDAEDIKPSRLNRARYKINDILKQRKEGQTALIAYAADAFVVSPLTDDADTISAQVPALETHIMPAQGSRLDLALEKAAQLFVNAGRNRGEIVILSDSINPSSIEIASELNQQGYRSSVLAIGTADGAPIPAPQGGFVKDANGAIVIARLERSLMQELAAAGGGVFSLLSTNDSDINKLLSRVQIDKTQQAEQLQDAEGKQFQTDLWHEEGPWLLLLVIPFAAYFFRRGLIFVLLIVIAPLPQPAQAVDWNSLWKNTNQQAVDKLQDGEPEQAAKLFTDPEWKAAAEYKSGHYQQAVEQLKHIDTAEAHYNRGNALAQSGQYDAAIDAYAQALTLDPEHADAQYNRQLVEKAKQQQQSSEQNQQGDPQNDQQNSEKSQNSNKDSSSDSRQNKPAESNNAQENANESNQQQGDSQKQPSSNEENKSAEHQQNEADDTSSAMSKEESQQEKDRQPTSTQQAEDDNDSEHSPLDLQQQQTQQWLKKIPDDPGGLLRRKFQYQYGREQRQNEQQDW